MTLIAWPVFVLAAVLEVSGDAMVRTGLRKSTVLYIVLGFLVLGCYGLMVNMVKWDFSKLLGVYIAFFALASILAGRFVFAETIPLSTWLGLGLIMAGGFVIQFGPR